MFKLYIDEDSIVCSRSGARTLQFQPGRLLQDSLAIYGGKQIPCWLARQQHYSVGEQMRRILKVMALRTAADMRDRVEFLSAWG